MKKELNYLRNLLWPFIEENEDFVIKLEEKKEEKDLYQYIRIEHALKIYDEQKDRIKTIDSKSMIFIGLFGSIIALLAFLIKDFLISENKNPFILILISVLILYIAKLLWCSIKALERKTYHVLNKNTFIEGYSDTVIEILKTVDLNRTTINEKATYMALAHDFLKRILTIVFVGTVCILAYTLFNIFYDLSNLFNILIFIENHTSILLQIIIFILCIFLLIKIRILEKKMKE